MSELSLVMIAVMPDDEVMMAVGPRLEELGYTVFGARNTATPALGATYETACAINADDTARAAIVVAGGYYTGGGNLERRRATAGCEHLLYGAIADPPAVQVKTCTACRDEAGLPGGERASYGHVPCTRAWTCRRCAQMLAVVHGMTWCGDERVPVIACACLVQAPQRPAPR